LSTQRKHVLVDSGHSVHIARPEAVVQSIEEMVEAIRQKRRLAP
jgi:hypothetical protein